MRQRKRKGILVLILSFILMMQTFCVQAASSDGYVTHAYNSPSVKIKGYQIKVKVNNLYIRKGTSGKWKKIASGLNASGAFTTNGSDIYYVKSNYSYNNGTGNSNIYRISVKGGKEKHVATFPNTGILTIHKYKDNLYLTEFEGKGGPFSTYIYSLKTKGDNLLKKDLDIYGAYKGYAIMNEHYDHWTVPLYSVNLATGKTKILSTNCYNNYASGKYVYYVDFPSSSSTFKPATFVIKRATIDGKNITSMTSKITGIVQNVTAHSVVYIDKNGITRTKKF